MKELFKQNRVNYILRTYLPTWNYEQRIEENVHFCKKTDTCYVMLFTDAQHIVWNQLTIDVPSSRQVNRDRTDGETQPGYWAFQLPRQVNMAAKATTNENRRCVMIETFGNKLRKLEIIAENSPGIDKRFSISREEFVARRPKWRR